MRYKGTFTALITPFIGDRLDEDGLASNIRHQAENGVDGIVALGTTGESSALTEEERVRVISVCVRVAAGKIPVMVGTGHNATAKAVEMTEKAFGLGADIALIVAPYYNKPTQEGIYHHFAAIARNVDMPILVYNIPGRTGVNIELATLIRLAQHSNIIGIKEASGSVGQAADIVHAMKRERPGFALLSGDDALTLPMMSVGASGVVSVASNLVPRHISALVNAMLNRNLDKALQQHHELLPLMKALFVETNPSPIKAAMQMCGMAAGNCRLPLCPLRSESRKLLEQVLNEMKLI